MIECYLVLVFMPIPDTAAAQYLVLVLVPPPQASLHVPKSDQVLQPPFIARNKRSQLISKNILSPQQKVLQWASWVDGSAQWFPPQEGVGLLQLRVLLCVPPPQVALQGPSLDQALQPPSTPVDEIRPVSRDLSCYRSSGCCIFCPQICRQSNCFLRRRGQGCHRTSFWS